MRSVHHPLPCWRAGLALLGITVAAFPALAQGNRKPTARHVELAGDLDALRIVEKLGAEIENAARADAGLIILQLDGDRSRRDVVWAVSRKIRESPVPFAVYLSDSSQRTVGVGQLAIGILAPNCFVEPGTVVKSVAGDTLADLVPADADIEQVKGELSGALYTRLTEVDAPAELSDLLADLKTEEPVPLLWVLYEPAGDRPARVLREDPIEIIPGTRSVQIVSRAPDGTPRLNIPAEVGLRTRLYKGSNSSAGGVAAAMGFKGGIKSRARIESGLSDERRRTAESIEALDALIERVKAGLDLPDPPDPATSPGRYRQAARGAQAEIGTGRSLLADIETALNDYPELLLSPAPGQTTVAGKPSVFATRWRSAVQSRRDKLDKWEAKARLFADR